MARISIILPVFNAQKTLAKAIQSVLEQTFSDWELLIVDDHSTDDSVAIAKSFADPRIRVLTPDEKVGFEKGGGLGVKAWALPLVESPLITFLDADDWYLPEKLEKQVAYLDTHPECQAVASAFISVNLLGQMVKMTRVPVRVATTRDFLLRKLPPYQQGFLYRREVFEKARIRPFVSSDTPFLLELITQFPGQIHYQPDVLWYYLLHPGSMVNNPNNLRLLEHSNRVYDLLEKMLCDVPNAERELYSGFVTKSIAKRAINLLDGGNCLVVRQALQGIRSRRGVRFVDWMQNCFPLWAFSFFPTPVYRCFRQMKFALNSWKIGAGGSR